MSPFLFTGHTAVCPAAHNIGAPCSGRCEAKLFNLTGVLALCAGSIELLVGFFATSSFAVADAIHALTDAFTDFFGAYTSQRSHEKPKDEDKIRRRGSFVTATAFVVATIPITLELVFHTGTLIPWAVIVAGSVPLVIHLFRWHLFYQGNRRQPTRTRHDLIRHVQVDTAHSGSVLITGCTFLFIKEEIAEGIDVILTIILILFLLWQAFCVATGRRHDHDHHHH